MVRMAIHCGRDRPATIRSEREPRFALRAARTPITRNTAKTSDKAARAKLGFYMRFVDDPLARALLGCFPKSVHTSVNAARMSACATVHYDGRHGRHHAPRFD